MSGLFNLKVNNVAAEDITLNGQTVEEVWVDGVQVFDAYDPTTIPAGALALPSNTKFTNYNYPENYTTGTQSETLQGQMGKKGTIKLTVAGPQVSFHSGQAYVAEQWAKVGYAKWGQCVVSSPLFRIRVSGAPYSVSDAYSTGKGDSQDYSLSGLDIGTASGEPRDGSEGHTRGGWMQYRWDFEQKKCWISSDAMSETEYNLTTKWREGMQVSGVFSRSTASSYSYNGDTASNIFIQAGYKLDISNS